VLKARGKAAEAVPFLTAFAKADPARLAPVAGLLEQLGQAKAAEELYAKLVSEAKRPTDVLLLALCVGRAGRPEEALRLCEGAWKTCPPEAVAQASLEILVTAKGGAAHAEKVARQFEAARGKAPGKTSLVVA